MIKFIRPVFGVPFICIAVISMFIGGFIIGVDRMKELSDNLDGVNEKMDKFSRGE